MRAFYYSFGLIILLAACKKTEPVDMEYDYFPTSQGSYVIYKVHEVHKDVSVNLHDTLDYFIKAKIGDTLTDNEGRIVRRYERYYGTSASGPWVIQDVWTTLINSNKAELVEENNRTVKLVFKPTETKEWNANAYNTMGALNCYYTNIGSSYNLNGLSFGSTIQVEQEDELNFIEYKRKYEVYAKGVGLIYKYFKDFTITGYNPNNVQKGTALIMEAVSYGVE